MPHPDLLLDDEGLAAARVDEWWSKGLIFCFSQLSRVENKWALKLKCKPLLSEVKKTRTCIMSRLSFEAAQRESTPAEAKSCQEKYCRYLRDGGGGRTACRAAA